MANPLRFSDSTTVVGTAPKPIDPRQQQWLNEAAARSAGMDFSRPGQLGNAWTDQYNAQLPGLSGFGPAAYQSPSEENVYRGAINSQGQRVDSDGDPLPPAPTGESDGAPGPPDITGPPIPSRNPLTTAPLAPAIRPGVRINPNPQTRQLTTVPWAAPKNAYRDERGRVRYETAPSRWDRAGRAVAGFFGGPDWGNPLANIAGRYVAGKNPLTGIPYAVGGAVSRAVSRKPVTKTWNPQDDALTQALNDPGAGSQPPEEDDDRGGMTGNQATIAGGRNAPPSMTVNALSSTLGPSTLGGGDYTDPSYNTPPTGGENRGPQPQPPSGTVSGSPLPTTSPVGGGPPPTSPPRNPGTVPNPENRVNPQTGQPDPNGVLPQHMPGYVPPAAPSYVPFTQQGVASIQALYQKYYGREATPEELQAHRGNPGGLAAIEAALKADTANLVPGAPGGPPAPPAPGTAAAQTGAGAGGGGYSYAGFDFGQDAANRDIGKSAKYAFSHFAGLAGAKGVPQPRSKQEAEAWFLANIAPGMNANGFQVHKVQGDKAFISTREFPQGQWVDFQVNSGGQGDQPLAWQAENYGAGADADAEALFAVTNGDGPSGMDRGAGDGVGGVLDSGNPALNGFAQRLIQQLLEGAALDDVLERERRTTQGLTPASLAAVGF